MNANQSESKCGAISSGTNTTTNASAAATASCSSDLCKKRLSTDHHTEAERNVIPRLETPAPSNTAQVVTAPQQSNEKEVYIFTCRNQSFLGKDFSISIGASDTLYNLVCSMFDFSLSELLNGEDVYSHLWKLVDKKKKMTFASEGSWLLDDSIGDFESERCFFGDEFNSDSDDERIATMIKECSSQSPVPLATINMDVGDVFIFSYDEFGQMINLSIELASINEYSQSKEDHQNLPRLLINVHKTPGKSMSETLHAEAPQVTPVVPAKPYTLTPEEIQARKLREEHEETVYSRSQRKVIVAPPHPWNHETERCAIIHLIYAGYKFTKAWNEFLQHTLLTRSKGTTSGKWYEIAKHIKNCPFEEGFWDCNLKSKTELLNIAWNCLYNHRLKLIKLPLRKAKFENHNQYRYALYRSEWGMKGRNNPYWQFATKEQLEKDNCEYVYIESPTEQQFRYEAD